MTESVTLAHTIHRLLVSFGWSSHVDRRLIKASEPTFSRDQRHRFFVGEAAHIKLDDLQDAQPDWVIIEDNAPSGAVDRVRHAVSQIKPHPKLTVISRFIDELW